MCCLLFILVNNLLAELWISCSLLIIFGGFGTESVAVIQSTGNECMNEFLRVMGVRKGRILVILLRI